MSRRPLLLLGALLPWSAVASALAQDDASFAIAVQGPDGAECIGADRLRASVAERTGRSVASTPDAAALRVDVSIEARAAGYRARIAITDASGRALGERELAADGACSALDDMLTLVIASSIGIEPTPPPAAAPEPQPPPIPFQLEAEHAAPKGVTPVAETEPSTPSIPWSFALEAAGRARTGLAPTPSAELSASLFAGHEALALVAGASWLPPLTSHDGEPLELELTAAAGELHACGRAAQLWSSAVWFCAGASAGALHARAPQLWHSASRWDGFLLVAPGVRLRSQLGSTLGMSLGLGAAVPLIFPRYSYLDPTGAARRLHALELGVWAELGLWLRID